MANIALRTARQASTHISRAFDRPDLLKISEKAHNDFVTNVDREVEYLIVEALKTTFPDHNITGEESRNNQVHEDAEYEWIIDPIDGTLNFLRQVPHFCVSIACLHKGKLEHAVIVDPMRNEEFVASRGQGCQLNGHRVRVSPKEELDGAMIATGGPIPDPDAQSQLYAQMLREKTKVRHTGSACLDLAYVAAGRFEGFWEFGLAPWDVAAGIVIVREAGGMVSEIGGGANMLYGGTIVAANDALHAPMNKLIKGSTRGTHSV